MAPLKQPFLHVVSIEIPALHGLTAVAPLKHPLDPIREIREVPLHGLTAVAPLKQSSRSLESEVPELSTA